MQRQVEYYFSRENLMSDHYLSEWRGSGWMGYCLRGQLCVQGRHKNAELCVCVRKREKCVCVCKGDCVMGEIACEEDLRGGERERR